ncbi:restriction endonuclease subunit S [Macrococcoides caseolyticum]|uniref:restriction endonuclease subunit S n=1 Tax=Macrococcoides caseolyticum TaxID=69966 RepID=UPI0010618095|nr:restriction endonuclease subunit S [Macrococcus caseolyticus]TDM25607.1 restriction endonuclease subunit S [Macrococcus caseolyticus]
MTNKNEQRKVPELRFPEFRGEWKENKLKDLTLLIKDGSHGTHKDVETGPWLLSAKNIKNNKINIDNNDRKISIDDYETIYRNYTLIKNDILLSIVGTIGRTALVENEENIAFQRSVAIIRPNKILTSTFLIQLMNGKRFQKDLKKYQVISAQPGIYLGDLNKLSISFPDKNEQQKIGEFFSKLDRQIELEEKKMALLEEQKKGYMQKIFSQELRFKDENGEEYPEWEENKLRNCSEYKTSNITIKSLSNEMSENLFPVYDANNIVGWSSDFQFNEGYISIIKDGAGAGRIRSLPAYSSILGTMGGITPNHKMMHLGFLYLILERINFGVFTTGSTIPHIYYSDYSRVQIPLPSKEEQLKISTFFNNIEQQQNCLKNRIKNLVIQKKELLTKIFV